MDSPTHEPRSVISQDARAEVPVEASPRVRCVLALAESSPTPPADLIEAFMARGIEVRKCVGLLKAMTKLVIGHRDEHTAVALVVVEPDLFGAKRAEELLRSAGKYTPRAARWVYDPAASPRLQKWVEPAPSEGVKVNGIRDAIRDVEGRPPLRLTGFVESALAPESPEPESSTIDVGGGKVESPDMLTEEELAMLLGTADLGDDDEPAAPTLTYEESDE